MAAKRNEMLLESEVLAKSKGLLKSNRLSNGERLLEKRFRTSKKLLMS